MTLDYHILPDLYCNMEAYLVKFYNNWRIFQWAESQHMKNWKKGLRF